MLTEILIKPYLDDLKHEGIKDTTPCKQGFLAGMTALSSILSDNIDNKAQLFVYLGMAISEGMQWVESQVSESPEKAQPIEFVAPTPSSDVKENDWDYIPVHDDLPASLIQKYAKKDVFFTHDFLDREKAGKAILDLSSNRLQVIDTSGNQIKRPYYIKLR